MIKQIMGSVVVVATLIFTARSIPINHFDNYDKAKKEALQNNKNILVMFTADWCRYCVLMKKHTLSNKSIQRLVEQYYIFVVLDTDTNYGKQMWGWLGAREGIPNFIVLVPHKDANKKIGEIAGYISVEEFKMFLLKYKKAPKLQKEHERKNDEENLLGHTDFLVTIN